MNYCIELKEVVNVFQYGIRGFENLFIQKKPKQKIFYCDEILEDINNSELYNVSNDIPCYVTFDIDCLTPYAVTGTSTPVFSGLGIKETALILRNLLKNKKVIGVDIVEGNVEYDQTNITKQIVLYLLINLVNLICIEN
jgi:arginase family enzyme